MVVRADLAFCSANGQALGSYEVVYTNATDEDAACGQALLDGCFPLAAFEEAGHQRMTTEMVNLKLEPGAAFNCAAGITGAEMQAAYGNDADEDRAT